MKLIQGSLLLATAYLLTGAAPVDNVLGELSAACKQSLLSIVTTNEPCLPLSQVWSQIGSVDWENFDSSNTGQYTPLLDTMCSAPRCSKSVTDALATKIQTDCSADSSQTVVQVLEYGFKNYEPLIALECTKNSQQEYCLLVEGADIVEDKDMALADIPDDRLCTECVQNWLKVYDQYSESYTDVFVNSTDVPQIKKRCGY